MSIPPTNPTLPVFDAIAAAIPTRNEPSCSLKTIDWTLGRSTTASTMANLRCGNSLATFSMPLAWEKPIPTTTWDPRRAMLRSACSRWASLVTSNSRYAILVSFLKRSAPAYAASLKDLSNFPPMSNTTAGTNSCAATQPVEASVMRTATAALSDLEVIMSALLDDVDRVRWHRSYSIWPLVPARLPRGTRIESRSPRGLGYARTDADRGEDLHGGSAGLLRGGATLLQLGARPVRERSGLRGARSLGPDRCPKDRRRATAAVRGREARRLAEAEPRDGRDQSRRDRRRQRCRRRSRRDRCR